MHPAEFSTLLHRALEARVGKLLEVTAGNGWLRDPQGIHDVRVASRRVRAVLDLVDPKVYAGFKQQRRRMKALTRMLGGARELDVHLANLDDLKRRGLEACHQAALEHAQENLDRLRRKTLRQLAEELEEGSIQSCTALLKTPKLAKPSALGDVQASAWNCLEPRLQAALAPIPALSEQEDAEGLHALRIHTKRLRYTLEILAPALDHDTAEALERLRQLQTILGEHHDLATLEALLWNLHGQLTERRRAVLATGLLDIIGLLAEDRRARFAAFQEFVPKLESLPSTVGLPIGSQP